MVYEVGYISGNSLKFKVVKVEAENRNDAVIKAFDREGRSFENSLVSVKELKEG